MTQTGTAKAAPVYVQAVCRHIPPIRIFPGIHLTHRYDPRRLSAVTVLGVGRSLCP